MLKEPLLPYGAIHSNNVNILQLHIVHYSANYTSMAEAMYEEDGLAVLGFLYEVLVFFKTMHVLIMRSHVNCNLIIKLITPIRNLTFI